MIECEFTRERETESSEKFTTQDKNGSLDDSHTSNWCARKVLTAIEAAKMSNC